MQVSLRNTANGEFVPCDTDWGRMPSINWRLFVLNTLMQLGKTRMIGGFLRRGVGGKLGTGLMLAYFGKKAWDMMRRNRKMQTAH